MLNTRQCCTFVVDNAGTLWQSVKPCIYFQKVDEVTDCVMISTRSRLFGVVVKASGELYGWEENKCAGPLRNIKNISSVHCAGDLILALDKEGVVWEIRKYMCSISKVFFLPAMKMIYAGYTDACGVDERGRFWVWGVASFSKNRIPRKVKLPFEPRILADVIKDMCNYVAPPVYDRYALDTENRLWRRSSEWKERKFELVHLPIEVKGMTASFERVFGSKPEYKNKFVVWGECGSVVELRENGEWTSIELPEPIFHVIDTAFFSSENTIWTTAEVITSEGTQVIDTFTTPSSFGNEWKKVQLPFSASAVTPTSFRQIKSANKV